MLVSVEKPGSPAETLVHFGKKGMKWGVRNTPKSGGGGGGGRSRKPARAPRQGVALGRSSREFRAQHPGAKVQARAIRGARKESYAREKAIRKMAKKDSVEAARMQRDHLNHPGTAVALRTTRGEKVAFGLLAGLGPYAAGASLGTGAGMAGERRFIERKQRKGGFK
jgi:hypothetical protein